jgi:Bacterial regulatory protein, arsR family.
MNNERDYGAEIDELRKDIAEIKEMLNPQSKKEKRIREVISSKMNPESQAKIDKLKEFAKETDNELGVVSYHGFLELGNRGSYWGTEHCSVKDLMAMPQDKISVVLSSLGNQQRWEILCAILNNPMTVAQIVEKFDMKTSGKAYHHLNNLIAADLVEEDKNSEKGTYAVKGHRVQGIIMIMAGVADFLIDTHYSNGKWEE